MVKQKKKKVFVGMSGGVDSSVAALILKQQGYEICGVFMHCWHANSAPPASCLRQHESAHANNCTTEQDVEDARRVAEHLGIPFYVWDFEKEYRKRVVDYMIDGYKKGITPNPDVECNREIKFGLFLERALKFGADFVATGHYVRLRREILNPKSEIRDKFNSAGKKTNAEEIYKLFQAKDKNKDQSYFLWTLTQEQLRHCLFPIGDYLKSDVRVMAKQAGLPTADKKDSQGVCFLGKVSISDFLKDYLPEKKGSVLNVAGEKIGEHNGAHFYTIGQRQGIGNIKHQKGNKIHRPVYVAAKDVKNNTVVVAEEEDDSLYTRKVTLERVNFINPNCELEIKNRGEMTVLVRVRYRQTLFPARIMNYELGIRNRNDKTRIKKNSFELIFSEPQRFVAAGQSAVFYEYRNSLSFSTRSGRRSPSEDGLQMLGGGIIVGF